jgi:hypothetical protein
VTNERERGSSLLAVAHRNLRLLFVPSHNMEDGMRSYGNSYRGTNGLRAETSSWISKLFGSASVNNAVASPMNSGIRITGILPSKRAAEKRFAGVQIRTGDAESGHPGKDAGARYVAINY